MTEAPASRGPRVLSSPLAASAFTFAVFALVLTRLFLSFPLIPDYDSYFHLAAAREYAVRGEIRGLEWARASIMSDGFGDKEFLFHWMLTPVVSFMNPSTGGRLALAILNALVAAVIANLAVRAIGGWGLAIAPLLYLTAGSLLTRSFRLRPEIGSVIILLLVIAAAARRRHTTLVILTGIYAIAYTGFHVATALMILFVVADWIAGRQGNLRLVGASLLGSAAGVLLHPQFPSNTRIWFVQNVRFFLEKGSLDVGDEILAPRAGAILTLNAGWWLALGFLWLSSVRAGDADEDDPMSRYFGLAAAAFGVFWLFMDRMSIYFIPLATMAILFEMRRRGTAPGAWSRFDRIRVPLALGIVVAVAIGLPATKLVVETLRSRGMSEADVAAMASRIPAQARVAAPWGETAHYVLWAPEARYLNVLDPVFMTAKNRSVHESSESLFRGAEPDTPAALLGRLDSEYVAFVRNRSTAALESRLRDDPRVETLYAGQNYLGRVRPEGAAAFIRDWSDQHGRAIPASTGWVDLGDHVTATEPCATAVHEASIGEPLAMNVEIATWGPAAIRVDGDPTVATRAPSHAILGQGLIVPIEWASGRHTITVQACRYGPIAGFYAVRRQ